MAVSEDARSGHRVPQDAVVNWDPVDQTVLANEQVIDGRGWRSGAPVEKREIPGYYLNITRYAEELLDCTLNKLPGWSERVRLIQENWIGKSFGVNFGFPYTLDGESQLLRVYTTRADTIMGVTFMAIARNIRSRRAWRRTRRAQGLHREVQTRLRDGSGPRTMEKEGLATGFFVTPPLTGANVESGSALRADGLRRRRRHGRAGP